MKRGFTLIVLVVVIAIIAILAAILFPVFAKAREKARQSSCMSNLKQIALGVLSYVQDYDELMPSQFGAAVSTNPPYGFGYHLFMPYIKNGQIWQCPSDATADCAYDNAGPTNYRSSWKQSYIHNTNVFDNALKIGMMARVSETPLMMDGKTINQIYGYPRWATIVPTYCATRHNEGANVSYADGHAKWVNQSTLFATNFYMGYQ